MAGLGFEMVRYADDMVVLCRTQEEAQTALEKFREWMAGAGLTLHPDKTRTVDMNLADRYFDFLGYQFKRSRRGKIMRLVRPKSLRKLRESIKPRTRRNNGKSMEAIVADLNRTLPGWFGYFKYVKASAPGINRRMDLHEIAFHFEKAVRAKRPWPRKRSPALAQPLLREARAILPARRPRS